MNTLIGQPIDRVDAPAKCGTAVYAAEFGLRNLAYASLRTSDIPCGRIMAIDRRLAEQSPRVVAVLTHENAGRLPYRQRSKRPQVDPQAGERLHVLQGPEILFAGQPIAIIVAELQQQADAAAKSIDVAYQQQPAGRRCTRTTCTAHRRKPEGRGAAAKPAVATRRQRLRMHRCGLRFSAHTPANTTRRWSRMRRSRTGMLTN